MTSPRFQLVAATPLAPEAFWTATPLGRSLRQPQHKRLEARIHDCCRQPLAIPYNQAIDAAPAGAVLLFCAVDLDLGPDPLEPQLQEALARFDLVGVAGNQRDTGQQAAWWLDPTGGAWDHPFLSGALRQGAPGAGELTVYGPVPMPVRLLDGRVLAVRADRLRQCGVRFDPALNSEQRDLAFSRAAQRAGLSLGTWPLPFTHVQPARALEPTQPAEEAQRSQGQRLRQESSQDRDQLRRATRLHRQGRDEEALRLLTGLISASPQPGGRPTAEAISCEAARAKAHTNRGAILQQRGDLNAAQRDYGEALRLDPNLKTAADNLLNLALLLRSQGNPHQALEALRMILRATPQRPDLLLQLGSTLMELGRVEAAVPCFRRLLRLEPRQREGHYQLGQALAALGDTEAGIAALNAALALDPTAIDVLVQLETQRLSLCDWDDYDHRMDRLLAQLRAHAEAPGAAVDGRLVPPLSLNLFPVPLALQRRLGEWWAEPTSRETKALRLPPAPVAARRRGGRQPQGRDGRWRIGYLSADFRQHAMGTLIHGLFAHHDRSRFEVYAYSLASYHDAITEAIRGGVDHYSEVAQESAAAIAQRIRADRLDVLIDLMGHTHHSRPAVLAMRPVPLQLHYLGYPGSLGADWIDGVIADRWLIPPEHEPHYRETVHRLPWGFVSSGPVPDQEAPAQPTAAVASAPPMPAAASAPLMPAVAPGPRPPSREALGLPADAVVYACFNRPEKITPVVFDAWLEILRQVPGSVLWILNDEPRVEERLGARLEAAGLAPRRLVFSPKLETAAFGQACALADLLLDTSPYGSGATAVTALAAGLPLLTWPGETFASRMGASLCAATGLEELICPSPSAYRERAIALGRQPSELRRLRRHLLERHHELPLFNTAAWVGHLESLLEGLLEGTQNQDLGRRTAH